MVVSHSSRKSIIPIKVKVIGKADPTIIKISNENIRDVYKISNIIIGSGQFGSVRLGSHKINPKKKFAIKSISK